jgi:L-amino acid N-acyltransferase YncA
MGPVLAAASRPRCGEGLSVQPAHSAHLDAICRIYNEGIEDRVATLDRDPKSSAEIAGWWKEHDERFEILVATESDRVVGWSSLNRFSHRCAHADIADLSVYVARDHRGTGVGYALLKRLIDDAKRVGFHKIVLQALDSNEHGKRLYRKSGFREVGVFREHGRADGRFVDVIAMEMLLQ